MRPNFKLFPSFHLFQRSMGRFKRITELTIANLMAVYFAQCLQKTRVLLTHLTISWHGKMEKSSRR